MLCLETDFQSLKLLILFHSVEIWFLLLHKCRFFFLDKYEDASSIGWARTLDDFIHLVFDNAERHSVKMCSSLSGGSCRHIYIFFAQVQRTMLH